MALIRKTNPVALDTQIDFFQTDMFAALGFTDWESFHRVYGVPVENGTGIIPEPFEVDGEYKGDSFYNDNVIVSSFFYATDIRTVTDGLTEVEVAWIFNVDLKKLFPSIDHRADEEFSNAVQLASEGFSGWDDFKLIGVESGIENVYREFNKDQIKFDNMSEEHARRFNYTVKYTPDCT